MYKIVIDLHVTSFEYCHNCIATWKYMEMWACTCVKKVQPHFIPILSEFITSFQKNDWIDNPISCCVIDVLSLDVFNYYLTIMLHFIGRNTIILYCTYYILYNS